jgi:hypothetical protein
MMILSSLECDAATLRRLHERRMALMQLRLKRCRVKQVVKAGDLPPPKESVWYHVYRCTSLFIMFSSMVTPILQASQ